MPWIQVRWEALKETKVSELVPRFAAGGAVTAAVGWVTHRFGPVAGGLFLAFPSILPAGLSLAEQHEGRLKAADEARGAIARSLGLAMFGLIVWQAPLVWSPALVLLLACLGWLVTAVVLWRARLV